MRKTVGLIGIFTVLALLPGCKSKEDLGSMVVKRINRELDLNAEQSAKLSGFRDALKKEREELRDEREKTLALVVEQIRADEIDPKAVAKIVEARRATADKAQAKLVPIFSDFHHSLSKEQREKIVAKIDRLVAWAKE